MKTVTLVWAMWHDDPQIAAQIRIQGKQPVAEKSFEYDDELVDFPDNKLLEELFAQTNLYSGWLWDLMQPLPDVRSHTSLSVGDYVVIENHAYRCDSVGWSPVDSVPVSA